MRPLPCAATVFPVTFLFLMCAAPPCVANMLVDPMPWSGIAVSLSIILLFVFSLTALTESMVVCAVLWCPPRLWWRVLAAVALVNLITLLPTQMTWWYFKFEAGVVAEMGYSVVVPMALLEALVVLAEFFLLRWQFGRLWRRGVFEKPVSRGRTICAALAANIVSFACGYVAL